MKKYTEEETQQFRANRKAIRDAEIEYANGNYEQMRNGEYRHTVSRERFNYYPANRTMVKSN